MCWAVAVCEKGGARMDIYSGIALAVMEGMATGVGRSMTALGDVLSPNTTRPWHRLSITATSLSPLLPKTDLVQC